MAPPFCVARLTKEFLAALVIDENERKSHGAKMHHGDNQEVMITDLIKEVKGRNTKSGRTPDKVLTINVIQIWKSSRLYSD